MSYHSISVPMVAATTERRSWRFVIWACSMTRPVVVCLLLKALATSPQSQDWHGIATCVSAVSPSRTAECSQHKHTHDEVMLWCSTHLNLQDRGHLIPTIL